MDHEPTTDEHRTVPVGAGGWTPFRSEGASTVHGTMLRQAAATPADEAVVGPTSTLTYADLDARSGEVAAGLAAHDVLRRPVAICMAHDVDLVAAVFGVLRAGATVLLCDPAAPLEFNLTVLADADAPVLLVDAAAGELATAATDRTTVVAWTDLLASGAAAPSGFEAPEVGPDDVAMLAYSSGTTGEAKAAIIPHRMLVHLFRGAIDALRIGPGDRLPMIFPISLAVAAYPMFLPLMVGGSLRIRDVRSVGLAGFIEWLADERVSVLYISPTVARFMGDAPAGVDLSSLRVVVLGGERVDAEAVDIVKRSLADTITIANGYGATETGVLTFYVVAPDDVPGPLGVPVGRPIPETVLEVVGDDGSPAPAGEPGDVFVSSPYMFDGYLHRADLDAAVLSERDGVARYRTGDFGLIDEDGNLLLVGRSDTEVKVRGHRINPGEVERALLSLAEVADAVVEGRPDRRGAPELVAWIVPGEGADLATIRSAARRVIRGPHLPARMVLLDALPQLPNGKLDRQALPDPRAVERAEADGRPTTPVEARLLALWEEVLDVRPLALDDDLVDLGASSFDLAWALVLLEQRQGVRVPMSSMIEARTVAEVAALVEATTPDAEPPVVVEVQPGAADRPRLFFVHDLHGTAYGLRHLAPDLGIDQPVWGFESPYLEGGPGVATLEVLATRYVAELRRVQPEGPYHLAGYSFGGVLAFEMASQLSSAGQEVEYLGIVDVGPGYRGKHYDSHKMLDKPWSRVPMPPPPEVKLRERARWYRDLVQRSPRDAAYHVSLLTGLDRWIDPLQFKLDLRDGGRVPPERRLWYAWRQHWELARRYRWEGRRLPGSLHLVWADESAATDGTMGWADVVRGPVEIDHVGIPHERMLQPDATPEIGSLLRAGLDRALANRQTPEPA